MNLSERDQRSIWHPFTQHKTAKPNIAISRAEGALLFDEDGKEYIDAVSSWWTNIFGHCNPVIAEAIHQQLKQLEHVIFAGFTHQPAVETAEKLLALLPDKQARVFFSDNGSTSVEVALKMAIQYWHNAGRQKTTVIAFKNAYHGDTFGAMSVGARGLFNRPFESLLFNVEFIDIPNENNLEQVLRQFSQLLEEKQAAAFIFEPLIQGSGGMQMYEPAYLDQLIAIAQKNGVICIADEVMTGFGRTGKVFASLYLQNQPDIFCVSKGITGGFMPLGITTCTQKIYDAFLSDEKLKTFFHGHSYTGNPLACAAASASLDLLKGSGALIENLGNWQKLFSEELRSDSRVLNLRQLGTIVAFEVRSGSGEGYFNDLRDHLYDQFIEAGILLRPLGNTVYVMPPYVITKQQLEKVYRVIQKVLNGIKAE